MNANQADIAFMLSRQQDNGADFWAKPDGTLIRGGPFSTLEAAYILAELGLNTIDPVLDGAASLIWNAQREDGRFRAAPGGSILPCQTIHAAKTLCYLGFAADARLERTFQHLLHSRHGDGGWRCNKFFFGHGPETESSNPGPTLTALDAFRFTPYANADARLDGAVEFLLGHWQTRAPLGPCHYGIGTLFHQVTFPFLSYNLFYYVFVLSFYGVAKRDARFLDALSVLKGKLRDDQVVVERPHAKLSGLSLCKKGEPSEPATEKFRIILNNLK
ncbi:MAG: prenyltransferase [Clostridiales bacterium]|nr:prenyltransferase [Clostridiales bacterium]